MSARDSREEGLRRLVRDARAEKTAELDWSRVEERLIRQAERGAPKPERSPYAFAWAALAIAAAVAVWLVSERSRDTLPQAPPPIIEATEPLRRNGNALALGTRIEAGEREVAVDHAGRATWTLAPSSSALLTERAERIAVRLERGSVLSEVVPNPKPETFIVEAAGTRVAVHGTVFRVALEGGRVIVTVREGTVAVGPIGAVPAFFLKAPAHGDFATDGRSGSIDGRPLGESAERRAEPLRLSPTRAPVAGPSSSALSPIPNAELPAEPSISDIETGIARIVDIAADCFSQNTKGADGVQITVRTALSLSIDSSGAVSDVDFQPSLSPDAEECAAAGIQHVTFAPSQQGAKVTRMLELKR
jgi:ferric-dicitrate binding protein FerR (iron transport regulator)